MNTSGFARLVLLHGSFYCGLSRRNSRSLGLVTLSLVNLSGSSHRLGSISYLTELTFCAYSIRFSDLHASIVNTPLVYML